MAPPPEPPSTAAPPAASRLARVGEVLWASLRLGLTAFGGPVAHLGYFRAEFVQRRRWLDERAFAELVALCQFLPGPASSQVNMGIGVARAGAWGGVAAWLGFTLPSAAALMACAYGVTALAGRLPHGPLQGLKIVAVAVVAQAVWSMARTLAPDRARGSIALLAAAAVTLLPGAAAQLGVIAAGALAGWALPRAGPHAAEAIQGAAGPWRGLSRTLGVACLALFAAGLALLPLAELAQPQGAAAVLNRFYRAGSLVFGGGHVVLPLLQAQVVAPGWVEREAFLAGYGAAQAVPGPLFTFSAYLGTLLRAPYAPLPGAPWAGGLLALAAMFAPSFLLLYGVLPFWDALRRHEAAQAALRGVNAAVVGLLAAALYDPVWRAGVRSAPEFALALAALALLALWRVPPWLVVLLSAAAGALLL
jgi:chromate transporter